MADSTIDSSLVILKDNYWPGAPLPNFGKPKDGWTGSSHHNVATAAFKVGTKVQQYHENSSSLGKPGWYEMIYLQMGTQGDTVAAKSLMIPEDATFTMQVTNNAAAGGAILGTGGVYAISAMTNAYYGWFWSGGVAPTDEIAGLDGNLYTDGNVAAGSGVDCKAAAGTSGVGTVANEAVLSVRTTLKQGFGTAQAADA